MHGSENLLNDSVIRNVIFMTCLLQHLCKMGIWARPAHQPLAVDVTFGLKVKAFLDLKRLLVC